jgi:hypothetical protein
MKRSNRRKALIFFAVRDGQKADLAAQIPTRSTNLLDLLSGADNNATGMVSRDNDFLRSSPGPVRAYDATIELRSDAGGHALVDAVAGLGERVADAQAVLADEELFVDRPNSVMFTSDEVVGL